MFLKSLPTSKIEMTLNAIHNDVFMREKIKEMLAALEKFSVSGDYCDYIAVSNSFDDVAKFMNARDSYMTHNPDRNY
jgi:hypothetical protein